MDPYMMYYTNIIVDLSRYFCIPLYVLENLGNIFSIIIFFRKPWKKNVCAFYFLIWLVLDLIYINSGMLGSIIIDSFNINLSNSNAIVCKIFNYVSLFFSTLSSTVLALASIDRLLISSQNVETRLYSSKRLAYFSISISTSFWLIFFIHILIAFDLQEIIPSVFICAFNSNGFYNLFFPYSLLIINITLFSIIIIVSIISFKNVRRIRLIPRQKRQSIRTMHKKDFQLLRCLFAKDIIYIICNTFLIIFTLYRMATATQILTPQMQALLSFLSSFSLFIYHIPYCVSFIVYIIISKCFRQELKRLIWKIFGRDLILLRDEERNEQEQNKNLNVVSTIVLTP